MENLGYSEFFQECISYSLGSLLFWKKTSSLHSLACKDETCSFHVWKGKQFAHLAKQAGTHDSSSAGPQWWGVSASPFWSLHHESLCSYVNILFLPGHYVSKNVDNSEGRNGILIYEHKLSRCIFQTKHSLGLSKYCYSKKPNFWYRPFLSISGPKRKIRKAYTTI